MSIITIIVSIFPAEAALPGPVQRRGAGTGRGYSCRQAGAAAAAAAAASAGPCRRPRGRCAQDGGGGCQAGCRAGPCTCAGGWPAGFRCPLDVDLGAGSSWPGCVDMSAAGGAAGRSWGWICCPDLDLMHASEFHSIMWITWILRWIHQGAQILKCRAAGWICAGSMPDLLRLYAGSMLDVD